ncbi:hypothetical protein EDB85DRAFT_1888065 [Lactarius pseudohatsudake]|nr:hypothetical protein EDB85DRAFT_1888065 [Lactarius pseudohatsudake]
MGTSTTVGGLVRGGPAWCWSGVGRGHGWDESCLAGVTAGWRSRGVARGVVVTSCQRGDGVARLTVGGLGRDVGGNERKKTKRRKKRKETKTKKTALNKVISRAGGVGGNAGLVGSELAWWWTLRIALRVSSRWILYVATAWRWGGVLVVEVDGDRGHEFMARRQGSCSGDVAELVIVLRIATAWRRGGAFMRRGTGGGG